MMAFDVLRWNVVGWGASGERSEWIAAELAKGRRPQTEWSSQRAVPVTGKAPKSKVERSTSTVPKPPRSVVIAWIVVAIAAVGIAVTIRTVVFNAEPSYVPPCERAGTGC